jgi:hypothetical protein
MFPMMSSSQRLYVVDLEASPCDIATGLRAYYVPRDAFGQWYYAVDSESSPLVNHELGIFYIPEVSSQRSYTCPPVPL